MDPEHLKQLQNLIASNPELAATLESPEKLSEFLKNPPPEFNLPSAVPLKSNEVPGNWETLLDSEGGLLVEPSPFFVLKYKEETGGKVFINLTGHSLIEEPEAKELIQNNSETGIRVPMSVGPLREDFDQSFPLKFISRRRALQGLRCHCERDDSWQLEEG